MKRSRILFTSLLFSIFIGSIVPAIHANVLRDGFIEEDEPGPVFWKSEIIYQVYPRSMLDSDEDGIGDLAGIASKLPYLKDLGIGIVWLSPIFKSPMADFGYDISNFTDVDPIFGTMEDFEDLIEQSHGIGLKVVMDLVPNHSSDEHEWFIKSVAQEDPYTDYYLWSDPSGYNETNDPLPPNNWLSVFGGPAWTWNEARQQFYLHQFLDKQPDLNFRNPDVREEMNNVIRFWMDKGVDGMRLDAVKHMFEVEDLSQNEPPSGNPDITNPNEYGYLYHNLTVDLPETLQVIRQWRLILDNYTEPKLMMAEVTYDDIETVMKYYGTEEEPLADFPFNFDLIADFNNRSDATGLQLQYSIDRWLDNMPPGKWANWVIGNHDVPRVNTRFGTDLVDALNMVTLLLPGTPVTYYGEEIGMENTFVSYNDTQDTFGCIWGPDRYDEFSRDPARTPMQWDNTDFAGFTSGDDTWLPVNENYEVLNVMQQEQDVQSSLKVYRALASLRRTDTGEGVFYDGMMAYPVVTQETFSFVRYNDTTTYLIVVNMATDERVVDLHTGANFVLPDYGEVVVRSNFDYRVSTSPGSQVPLTALPMLGGEGMVLITTE